MAAGASTCLQTKRDDPIHAVATEWRDRCLDPHEQHRPTAAWPSGLDVIGERLADLDRDWHPFPAIAFAADDQLSGSPVDVRELD